MLHTAAVSAVRPLLGSGQNGQALLYLFQKHLICLEYIVYGNVVLGPSIELLGELIKQGRVHTKLHSLHCLKAPEESKLYDCFQTGEQIVEAACAVPHSLPACLFTPTLIGIKLTSS
jgi:hypothetical protein